MDPEFKICPDCFSENDIDAKFCNNCGLNFEHHNDINEFNINVFYNIDDLVDDAVLVYEGEDYSESLELIDSYLNFNSEDSYAWSFKSHVLYKLGFIKDSISCCDIALNFDDMCVVAWSSKAFFYNILKEYDKAISCCECCRILDSNNEYILKLMESILGNVEV